MSELRDRDRQLRTLRRLRQLEEDEARAGLAVAESARHATQEELEARRSRLTDLDAERAALLTADAPLDPERLARMAADAERAADQVDERATHLRICDERCGLERDRVVGAVRQRHVVERVESRHDAETKRVADGKQQQSLLDGWNETQEDDRG
jgi:hypothetical protein